MATFLQYFQVLFVTLSDYGHGNPCYEYKLNNNTIEVKDCEKHLGVTISADLKSSKHVALAVKKAETALGLLKRTVVSEYNKYIWDENSLRRKNKAALFFLLELLFVVTKMFFLNCISF